VKKGIIGTISLTSKGTGYVKAEGIKKDIEIPPQNLNTALHGDKVLVSGNEVVRVVERAKIGFAGELLGSDGKFFVKPDDPKMYTDIFVSTPGKAKLGDKVFAELLPWRDPKLPPEGRVVDIFGRAGENNAEMHAIAREKGFKEKISHSAEEDARQIQHRGIAPEDYKERRDFRDVLTFTIDPVDAKDFDDALSVREIEKGKWEVGVHIADVTHYVKEGSAIDREARERSTSVYLVDRTIPMLPEVLSNDLCSLRPNTDRLTMSAVFVLDQNAKVLSEWYGRTVIHSKKRFTYEEAEEAIKKPSLPYHSELSLLNKLAKKMMARRRLSGAISMEQEEVRFVLDDSGRPIKVVKYERGDSHKLIEEFMLLANMKVAEEIPEFSIYRVHDLPSREKMADLHNFLGSFGYHPKLVNGVIPSKELNLILEDLRGKAEEEMISRAVTRSMAKAIYSTKNIGHFGLAIKFYTHFTSPIRRYPDMVTHRLLSAHFSGKKIPREKIMEFEEIARKSSEQERRAQDAEWASIKWKQAEYMSERIGKVFSGIVSGVTEWGLYVAEAETKSEGLVRVRDLSGDFYELKEKKFELVGKRTKKKFHLGQKVRVKVKSVDLKKRTIDYVIA